MMRQDEAQGEKGTGGVNEPVNRERKVREIYESEEREHVGGLFEL